MTASVTRARTRIGMVHRLSEQLRDGMSVPVAERSALLEHMRATGVLQGWESWEWLVQHASYDVAQALERLRVPTLFMHGARDRVVDPRSHDQFRESLKSRSDTRFRFELFQEMGHNGEDTTRKAFTLRDDMIATMAQWILANEDS